MVLSMMVYVRVGEAITRKVSGIRYQASGVRAGDGHDRPVGLGGMSPRYTPTPARTREGRPSRNLEGAQARHREGAVTRGERIEVHTGDINRPYAPIKPVKVRISSLTIFSRDRTIEEVNEKLRETAARLGGNAVIQVAYTRGMSLWSWKALTAVGLVVLIDPEPTGDRSE
jgi:hypothetical protein